MFGIRVSGICVYTYVSVRVYVEKNTDRLSSLLLLLFPFTVTFGMNRLLSPRSHLVSTSRGEGRSAKFGALLFSLAPKAKGEGERLGERGQSHQRKAECSHVRPRVPVSLLRFRV